jgi:hypothetical protein
MAIGFQRDQERLEAVHGPNASPHSNTNNSSPDTIAVGTVIKSDSSSDHVADGAHAGTNDTDVDSNADPNDKPSDLRTDGAGSLYGSGPVHCEWQLCTESELSWVLWG